MLCFESPRGNSSRYREDRYHPHPHRPSPLTQQPWLGVLESIPPRAYRRGHLKCQLPGFLGLQKISLRFLFAISAAEDCVFAAYT
jgi:hypothetical protein